MITSTLRLVFHNIFMLAERPCHSRQSVFQNGNLSGRNLENHAPQIKGRQLIQKWRVHYTISPASLTPLVGKMALALHLRTTEALHI